MVCNRIYDYKPQPAAKTEVPQKLIIHIVSYLHAALGTVIKILCRPRLAYDLFY